MVLGDEYNAYYGALGEPGGIAVLSGTGSFAVCCTCGKTHRELPDGVIPYKRMSADYFTQVANVPTESALDEHELRCCFTGTFY